MSVEAITEALHEYIYEPLSDSSETEDENKIRCLNERKTKSTEEPMDKPTNFKKLVCKRYVEPTW